jgi:phosphoadenosine phosphosulfate reductase
MEETKSLKGYPKMNKHDSAIERIRLYCSKEQPYLAFSGGKDSQATYHLTIEALKGKQFFDAHYNVSMEPPELKQFIRNDYPNVFWDKYPDFNFYTKMSEKGFPLRQRRWCCEYMKEWGGSGRIVITGLRAQESPKRRHYGVVEHRGKSRINPEPKVLINPIIDWTSTDVWQYLKSLNVNYCSLYDEGATGRYKGDGIFRRLGCVLCPMETVWQKNIDLNRWPKIGDAWRRSFQRLWDYRISQGNTILVNKWRNANHMFSWYVNEEHIAPKEQYCFVFE